MRTLRLGICVLILASLVGCEPSWREGTITAVYDVPAREYSTTMFMPVGQVLVPITNWYTEPAHCEVHLVDDAGHKHTLDIEGACGRMHAGQKIVR